jgi:hypothetical protein
VPNLVIVIVEKSIFKNNEHIKKLSYKTILFQLNFQNFSPNFVF